MVQKTKAASAKKTTTKKTTAPKTAAVKKGKAVQKTPAKKAPVAAKKTEKNTVKKMGITPKTVIQTEPKQSTTTIWWKKHPVLNLGIVCVAAGAAFFFGQFAFFKANSAVSTIEQKKVSVSDNTVVAKVNGEKIYLKDVKEFANNIPQLAEVPFDVVYPRLLETMINNKVMLNAAEKSGMTKDEDVQKALETAREQIITQAYMARELESMITPEKLRQLYLQEIQNFPRQDEIKARHILVDSKSAAQDIIIQLDAGADFAELANEKSLSPEKNGGELGYFTKNMMIPEFAEAVFKLKKGQISEPIQTPFGWHIVQVEDRRLASPPSFDDVKEELQQLFATQNVQRIIDKERTEQRVIIKKPTL